MSEHDDIDEMVSGSEDVRRRDDARVPGKDSVHGGLPRPPFARRRPPYLQGACQRCSRQKNASLDRLGGA
jgi:hypothetical protein